MKGFENCFFVGLGDEEGKVRTRNFKNDTYFILAFDRGLVVLAMDSKQVFGSHHSFTSRKRYPFQPFCFCSNTTQYLFR